jgi:hypothetical protein
MSASATAVTAAVRACPDGSGWPVIATRGCGGRGLFTSALTGSMLSSAHASAAADTTRARHRRQNASATAITPRAIHMTVPPATTLSTFAVEVAHGVRITSIQRSHWLSGGCTQDGAPATMAVRAPARARQARPVIVHPGAARLIRPPWPPGRLTVAFAPCPGCPAGTVATMCGSCP